MLRVASSDTFLRKQSLLHIGYEARCGPGKIYLPHIGDQIPVIKPITSHLTQEDFDIKETVSSMSFTFSLRGLIRRYITYICDKTSSNKQRNEPALVVARKKAESITESVKHGRKVMLFLGLIN
jgi:hypothetical protein